MSITHLLEKTLDNMDSLAFKKFQRQLSMERQSALADLGVIPKRLLEHKNVDETVDLMVEFYTEAIAADITHEILMHILQRKAAKMLKDNIDKLNQAKEALKKEKEAAKSGPRSPPIATASAVEVQVLHQGGGDVEQPGPLQFPDHNEPGETTRMLASLNLPAAQKDLSGDSTPQSIAEKARGIVQQGGLQRIEQLIKDLPVLLTRNRVILDESLKMLDDEETTDSELRAKFNQRWNRTPSGDLYKPLRADGANFRSALDEATQADQMVRERYNTHCDMIALLCKPEKELVAAIPSANPTKTLQGSETSHQEFSSLKQSNAREEVLKKLAAAHDSYMEISNMLHDGTKFYNGLTEILFKFRNRCRDIVFARKKESDKLLKELQQSIAQEPSARSINVPVFAQEPPQSKQQPPARPPPPPPHPAGQKNYQMPMGYNPYAYGQYNPYAYGQYNPYAYGQMPYMPYQAAPGQQQPPQGYPGAPPPSGQPYPGYPQQPPQ